MDTRSVMPVSILCGMSSDNQLLKVRSGTAIELDPKYSKAYYRCVLIRQTCYLQSDTFSLLLKSGNMLSANNEVQASYR